MYAWKPTSILKIELNKICNFFYYTFAVETGKLLKIKILPFNYGY